MCILKNNGFEKIKQVYIYLFICPVKDRKNTFITKAQRLKKRIASVKSLDSYFCGLKN